MPTLSITIPEVHTTVSRPVCQSILKQVCDITKIPPDTKVYYPGETTVMQTPGSALDSLQDRKAVFNAGRYTFVEVTQSYNADAIGTTATHQPEHPSIFCDSNLGFVISPIYVSTDVELAIRFRTHSRTEAKRWMDDMRLRVSQMRDVFLHRVAYHYFLPLCLEELIEEIHSRREAQAGYGEDFSQYVRKHITPRATAVADSTAKNKRLAIRDPQSRIQGVFGSDGGLPDKPERDAQTGTYQASFVYKFTYDRPIALRVQYPVMVHNQLLAPKFIEFDQDDQGEESGLYARSISSQAFAAFEIPATLNRIFKDYESIRLPAYDDGFLPDLPRSQSLALTALCAVGDDGRTLFNLGDLQDHCVDPDVLVFIKDVEREHITKPYGSMICLDLLRGPHRAAPDALVITEDLSVVSRAPLSLRTQHRVQLSLTNDLALVPWAFFQRLKNHPKAFVAIMSGLNPILMHSPGFCSLYKEKIIHNWQLSEVFEFLTGYTMNGEQSSLISRYASNQSLKLLADIPADVLKTILAYRTRLKTQMTHAVLVHQLSDNRIDK